MELSENAVFACTCGQMKTKLFENTEDTLSVPIHSTQRNIRNFFKMTVGRFPFLPFILALISNLISCFQANLALLILQADYSRRRQNIIRLLSLPVSTGGRLDLPLVWLCFCPGFDPLNCFCDFEERHNNINPHRSQRWRQFIFRGLITANTYASRVRSRPKLTFSNRFIVYVWTDETEAKTVRVDANFLANGERELRFQRNTDTCGHGLRRKVSELKFYIF